MRISELKDADVSLVEIKEGKPHCKLHGAMNKLTKEGIWRCVATYRREGNRILDENACKAGCQEKGQMNPLVWFTLFIAIILILYLVSVGFF